MGGFEVYPPSTSSPSQWVPPASTSHFIIQHSERIALPSVNLHAARNSISSEKEGK